MANEELEPLRDRAFRLAERVFRLYPKLVKCGTGHAWLARELLKAAGSIGANLEEGSAPSSRRDMAAKYGISLRESREGYFWSRLIATDRRWSTELQPVIQEMREFVAMLTVAVKKLRRPAPAPLRVRSRSRRSPKPAQARRNL
jgi:four helix bundle protein